MSIKLYGPDISHHQGTVNMETIAKNYDFIMIRLGYSHYTGGITIDNKFLENVKAAVSNGIDYGVYVYSYDKTPDAAAISARRTIEIIEENGLTPTYPVVFDIEDALHQGYSKELNTNICRSFLSVIEKAGYYAMLYSYASFAQTHLDMSKLSGYDFWVAQWIKPGVAPVQSTYAGAHGIWQFIGDAGSCLGVTGPCDQNVAYKDYASIIQTIGLNGHETFDPDDLDEVEDDIECECKGCADPERLAYLEEALAHVKQLVKNLNDSVKDL